MVYDNLNIDIYFGIWVTVETHYVYKSIGHYLLIEQTLLRSMIYKY